MFTPHGAIWGRRGAWNKFVTNSGSNGSCRLSITRCLRLLGTLFVLYSMTVIDFIVLLAEYVGWVFLRGLQCILSQFFDFLLFV